MTGDCATGCELGVWSALGTAGPNDKLTAGEVAAVAAVACGRRVEEDEARTVLRELVRAGLVARAGVRRTGKATVQVFWLTADGRRRAVRMLA